MKRFLNVIIVASLFLLILGNLAVFPELIHEDPWLSGSTSQ